MLDRSKCSKNDCNEFCIITLVCYTSEGPLNVHFCISHLLTINEFIDNLIVNLVTDADDTDHK